MLFGQKRIWFDYDEVLYTAYLKYAGLKSIEFKTEPKRVLRIQEILNNLY